MIIEKNENILNAKEQYLVHQTNCVSNYSAGLALLLFNTYPYSDSYSNRINHSIPGSIEIKGDGINNRYIINLYGQYYPGKPNGTKDNIVSRQNYFKSGLDKISNIPNIASLAVPFKIGCGLAGGDWDYYYNELVKFHDKIITLNNKFIMAIYKI